MKAWLLLLILVIGVALGVSGTYLAPDYILPYLPEVLKGKSVTVEGKVIEKELKQASLLLTINTNQGALLATFKKKVEQIGLLVNKGDIIEFVIRKYEPFVEDPVIRRVKKGETQPGIQPEQTVIIPPKPTDEVPLPEKPEESPPPAPVEEKAIEEKIIKEKVTEEEVTEEKTSE